MQRRTALATAAVSALVVLTGGTAIAAATGAFDGQKDNVGKLTSTTAAPTVVTVVLDPATGTATYTDPNAAPADPGATSGHGHEGEEHEGGEHESHESDD